MAKASAKKASSRKAKAARTAKVTKKPGVFDSIVEFLRAANAKQPITKQQLVKKLAARFKDRDAKGLATTVACQLGKRIEQGRGVKLNKNADGYWIAK